MDSYLSCKKRSAFANVWRNYTSAYSAGQQRGIAVSSFGVYLTKRQ